MSRPTGVHSPATTHLAGLIGEAHFMEFACRSGWYLYRGVDGHTPCDFIADTGDRLVRVEVKRVESVQVTDGTYYYCTCTKIGTVKDRFDYLFVSTPSGDYWIPAEAVPRDTLSIKQSQGNGRPGKYEAYRV